eukprot:CAMPEP_0175822178 /NCGR_PEP_ID=MMETSP0107_2-20121207/9539_1 /TAXON_ID=195067 ORGANISM="Goniomonas pacifica, Strain CCMP1869" /NCGR_SAMPLE_ID=MMETSP0107_2 /ASSEMBLY_ACC=CAM_ASM_000203 /LENGTH=71 /DNA_ID=CAMNT_0017134625 /DNA_START=122 /DNA_END=338 /DNA_ORIENTATION=+
MGGGGGVTSRHVAQTWKVIGGSGSDVAACDGVNVPDMTPPNTGMNPRTPDTKVDLEAVMSFPIAARKGTTR